MQLPVLPNLDPAKKTAIQAHQDDLAKPQGSLGRLEALGNQMAWIAGSIKIDDPEAYIFTFGGDHGIAKHGVSAFPQEVTPQMVVNMALGGAAINVLCRANRVHHAIVDVGVAVPCEHPKVVQRNVMRGTGDPLAGPVMSREQAEACLQVGIDMVMALPQHPFALLGVGEVGIANSAVAAILTSVFTGVDSDAATGPGTGVQGSALENKRKVIRQVIEKHRPDPKDPIGVLAAVGGTEFGAMAGAMLAAASRGWAVIVDGYIAGAAACLAMALDPKVKDFMVWSHRSAEPGATKLLEKLGKEPILDLGFRLGEGTGAAMSVPVLRSACAIMREMLTFSGAGVSTAV
ncbi:nicotinate-nucleotide--dimethylbenzimidazole phosphoribosyltransferase [Holophaga foetida]|uniref:nicotinate-nucleotide--dimethylbenzimidazole phosphoribosyltransferase n=1 Tax=Holophaga foetida TaxID=35839 RepID=UPI0002474615|nr:nicotinate-nucleotide--dimethylbenzimidazole phosphoribosyltransferase [Holophaga foetida]